MTFEEVAFLYLVIAGLHMLLISLFDGGPGRNLKLIVQLFWPIVWIVILHLKIILFFKNSLKK